MADHEQLLTLASDIVSAHVSNNAVPPDQLPSLIQQVFNTLATVEQKAATPPRPEPAVPIKQSVTPGHVVCLECGKQFSMIKRHLTTDHQLTPEQYRKGGGYRCRTPRRPELRQGPVGIGKEDRARAEGYDWKEEGWTRTGIVEGRWGLVRCTCVSLLLQTSTGTCQRSKLCSQTSSVVMLSEQLTWAIMCLALCGHAKSAICLWQVTT